MLEILIGAVALGLLWAVMALGVYISFRVLEFADLTVDSSFTTGGGVAATEEDDAVMDEIRFFIDSH